MCSHEVLLSFYTLLQLIWCSSRNRPALAGRQKEVRVNTHSCSERQMLASRTISLLENWRYKYIQTLSVALNNILLQCIHPLWPSFFVLNSSPSFSKFISAENKYFLNKSFYIWSCVIFCRMLIVCVHCTITFCGLIQWLVVWRHKGIWIIFPHGPHACTLTRTHTQT